MELILAFAKFPLMMKTLKTLVVLGMLGTVLGQGNVDEEEHKPGTPFQWGYSVDESHSRKEQSDGDVVTGEYRVLQDDGRTRIVRYTADWKNGVKVDISYEGQAHLTEEGNLSQGIRPSTRPPPPISAITTPEPPATYLPPNRAPPSTRPPASNGYAYPRPK